MTDKLWQSSDLHRYYYIDTDSKKRVEIRQFCPSDIHTFYRAETVDGRILTLHYQRILVEENQNENQTTPSGNES